MSYVPDIYPSFIGVLHIITAEIRFLENSMAKSMTEHAWEIGRRLVRAKESVGHGNFGSWIEENFEFSWQYATQFMRYYNNNPNFNPRLNLPTWKHVNEVLSLPESINRQDFIEQPHTIPSTGEQKTVDEMTVRELREVKKALQVTEHSHINSKPCLMYADKSFKGYGGLLMKPLI
jgi:hypothetical protein